MLSLDMAYRSFREVLAGSTPASIPPPSINRRHPNSSLAPPERRANPADFQTARVAAPTSIQTKSARAPPPPEITARRFKARSVYAPRAHRRQPAALAREGWPPAVRPQLPPYTSYVVDGQLIRPPRSLSLVETDDDARKIPDTSCCGTKSSGPRVRCRQARAPART